MTPEEIRARTLEALQKVPREKMVEDLAEISRQTEEWTARMRGTRVTRQQLRRRISR